MATTTWTGNALPVAGITTWTFAGTWSVNDTITFTINGKDYVHTLASATIATFLASILTGLQAMTADEFTELTWTNPTSSTIVATSASAIGEPAIITVTRTTATSGTVNGGASSTGTATQTATGPNYADNVDNWNNGLPVDGDTIVFANSSVDCLYGLAQSAITPANIYIDSTYTGNIGLPLYHSSGSNPATYAEYRGRYLEYCNSADATNTKVFIGRGPGNGSRRINLNTGTGQVTILVQNTDRPNQAEQCSFYWKGTHASNSLSAIKGSLGIAFYPGEVATVVSPTFSYTDIKNTDVTAVLGPGVTITTGMNIFGGTITTESNVGTVTGNNGILNVNGTATGGTLSLDGLEVIWRSTGTITHAKIGDGGALDATEAPAGFTCTDVTLTKGARLFDPFKKITYTNAITLNRCGLADVTLDFGEHITLVRANAA